jgi:hypothetical protein
VKPCFKRLTQLTKTTVMCAVDGYILDNVRSLPQRSIFSLTQLDDRCSGVG